MNEIQTNVDNKNELKIQALREQFKSRLSSVTDELENAIADLRVEYTQLSEAFREATEEIERLRKAWEAYDVPANQEEPTN